MAQKWKIPCVIVNPAVAPSITLARHIGEKINNFVTGEPVNVTVDDMVGFANLEKDARDHYNGELVNLFLAKDDEVLDYSTALAYHESAKSVDIKDTGSHRFEQHWPAVINKIRSVISSM